MDKENEWHGINYWNADWDDDNWLDTVPFDDVVGGGDWEEEEEEEEEGMGWNRDRKKIAFSRYQFHVLKKIYE